MENLIFFLYILHFIKVVNVLLIVTAILMGTLLIIYVICVITECSSDDWPFFDNDHKYSKPFKIYLRVYVTVIFLNIMIPSHETFAMMYVIPKISDSTFVKEQVPELFKPTIDQFKDEIREVIREKSHK